MISRIFLRFRGDVGKDISSGPLSDRIRECAAGLARGKSCDVALEVGVGEGLLAKSVIDGGSVRTLVGVDVLKQQLIEAGLRIRGDNPSKDGGIFSGRLKVVVARGETLPFKEGAFNLAITVNTLHNQPSWDEASVILGAVCNVVRFGGSVIFDIRNRRDPLIYTAYRFSTIIDPSTRRLPVNAYSISRVKGRLTELGFDVVKKVPIRYRFWPIPSGFLIEAVRIKK
ncbi:MAG: class I SAM-dependent methyltransferase [Deltaproteobacteria bacterium]|uniref:Class I SAM-dependent methyltransferase n=1 Tax=Candidatus Zymogenus saltonus TaxID=2844893 RepID=A0A9D8KDW3_9DELT|nr:class I SAM-dependent methyltransferase [Candidatus Zymogenus saltonus]